jgi:hypothetical protein
MGRLITIALRTLWAAALVVFVACALYPVGTTVTRTAGALSFAFLWVGLMVLLWKWRGWRWFVPAATLVVVVFLVLPGRSPSQNALREKYSGCLQRYEGVRYVWGGENAVGIDCSGLVRRGLMDALFLEGLRTVNPGLVREALALWWHDTTAKVLGEASGPTMAVTGAPQINLLDHSLLRAGDMAVTESGIHILAYLGDQTWIEADPAAEKVITVKVPSQDNPWLATPVKIVRWKILQP